jgi:phosphoglycolate phosphatase-like HAD superfamily hydrolase
MYKTIIFRLEGVVLNEEILKFKIYEKLWYHLRRNPEYGSFKELLDLRNRYAAKGSPMPPYIPIIRNHLTEIEQVNILEDIALLERKMSNRYLRKVPGITAIIQSLRYYYKIYLLARDSVVTRNAVKKFGWDKNVYYLKTGDGNVNPSHFRETLNQLINISRTTPAETIFVGEIDFPDIQVAQQSGISTIKTTFSFQNKGFTPQNNTERLYVESIERESTTGPMNLLSKAFNSDSAVKNPEQLIKRIEDMEESRPTTPQYQKEESKISIWDIAKKILNPE